MRDSLTKLTEAQSTSYQDKMMKSGETPTIELDRKNNALYQSSDVSRLRSNTVQQKDAKSLKYFVTDNKDRHRGGPSIPIPKREDKTVGPQHYSPRDDILQKGSLKGLIHPEVIQEPTYLPNNKEEKLRYITN